MKKYLFIISIMFAFISCTKEEIYVTPKNINNNPIVKVKTDVYGCVYTTNCSYTTTNNTFNITYYSNDTISVSMNDINGLPLMNGDTVSFNYIKFKTCNQRYSIRCNYTSTVIDNTIDYTDCLLPLNGMSGKIRIKF